MNDGIISLNYLEIRKFSFLYDYFMYLDTNDYSAEQIFRRNKVRVRFWKEMRNEKLPEYILVFCKVRKKDKERFYYSIEELKRKMLILGKTDYEGIFMDIINKLRNAEQ